MPPGAPIRKIDRPKVALARRPLGILDRRHQPRQDLLKRGKIGDWNSTRFLRQGNTIVDRKSTYCNAGWYAMYRANFVWMKVTQHNRLVAKKWVGEDVVIVFPSHNFTMKKFGVDTWILVE